MILRISQRFILLPFSLALQVVCGPCMSKPQNLSDKSQSKQSRESVAPLLQRDNHQSNQMLRKAIADNTPLAAALVPLVAEYAKRNYIMQRKKYTNDMRRVTKLIPLNPYCVAATRDFCGADIYDVTSQKTENEQQRFEGVPSSDWFPCASASLVALSQDEFALIHFFEAPHPHAAGILDTKYRLAIKNLSDSSKNREMPSYQAMFGQTKSLMALSANRVATVVNSWMKIWNTQSCQLVSELNLGHCAAQFLIAMPNDRIIVAFNNDQQAVCMYDLATNKRRWGIWNKEIIDHMIKLADDTILIIGSSRGMASGSVLRRVDSQTGQELDNSHDSLLLLGGQVTSAQVLSPDRIALSLRDEGNVLIIDLKGYMIMSSLPTHTANISCLALIKNILISGSQDGSIVLRNMINHQIVARLTHNHQVQEKAKEQSEQHAASAAAGAAESVQNERPAPIRALAVLAENRFASGDDQGNVIIWELDMCDVCH